jgi:predicted kinase
MTTNLLPGTLPRQPSEHNTAPDAPRTTGVLIAVIGPPGAGKSTTSVALAAASNDRCAILSLDRLRALVSPWRDSCDQQATEAAVQLLHSDLEERLECGHTVIVDATLTVREHRAELLRIAERHGATARAITLLPELKDVLRRNAARDDTVRPCGYARQVPAELVVAAHQALSADADQLSDEGWNSVEVRTA